MRNWLWFSAIHEQSIDAQVPLMLRQRSRVRSTTTNMYRGNSAAEIVSTFRACRRFFQ